jgi:ketosteroid isomerase-like protein
MLPAMAMLAQSDAEVKQMIERNNKMIGEAMMAGNIDKVMAMYTEDAVQLPNNSKMLKGKSAIRMDQEEMVKEGWKVKEYNTNVQSVETHGDVVTEVGTYSMAVQKDGMPDMVRREGKYLCVWEKQADGSLKLQTEIWNHDQNYESMAEGKMDKDHMMKDKTGKDKSKMTEDKTMEPIDENK